MPCRMAGPRGHPPLPVLSNSTGLLLQAARTKRSPLRVLCGITCSRTAGKAGSSRSGGHHPPHRADPSDPGAVCLPEASALGRWQVRQPRQGGHRPAERPAAVLPPGERGEDGIRVGHASRGTVGFVQSAVPVTPLSLLRSQLPLKGEPLAYRVIFSYRLRLQSSRALLF